MCLKTVHASWPPHIFNKSWYQTKACSGVLLQWYPQTFLWIHCKLLECVKCCLCYSFCQWWHHWQIVATYGFIDNHREVGWNESFNRHRIVSRVRNYTDGAIFGKRWTWLHLYIFKYYKFGNVMYACYIYIA